MLPLFVKGFKQDLKEEDLYPHLSSHESTYLGNKLQRQWSIELKNNPTNPSLWKCLLRVFGRQLGIMAAFYFCIELFVK